MRARPDNPAEEMLGAKRHAHRAHVRHIEESDAHPENVLLSQPHAEGPHASMFVPGHVRDIFEKGDNDRERKHETRGKDDRPSECYHGAA